MKVKLAFAQVNPTVGDIDGNLRKILEAHAEAARLGADIAFAPECALSGYPLEDLVLRRSFVDAVDAARERLVAEVLASGTRTALVFGAPCGGALHAGVHNAAFLVDPAASDGMPTRAMTYKTELPNYGPFDEKRTFVPGSGPVVFDWRGFRLGVMVCEDAWFPRVSAALHAQGADLLVAINGSPFESGKDAVREAVVRARVAETGLPMAYVNLVGGQDELVFDGGSFLDDGEALTRMPAFAGGVFTVDHDLRSRAPAPYPGAATDLMDGIEEAMARHMAASRARPPSALPDDHPSRVGPIYRACVLGLRDYLAKQDFRGVVVGMSGGVDSALVSAMACDALGPDLVTLVRMPSRFSSPGSLSDAALAAGRQGVRDLRTASVEGVAQALRHAYVVANDGRGGLSGTADENVQARARGALLMAVSNQEGRLVLTTGNKSEVSVGYSTLYGDMAGGFNPLKDVYKTVAWAACRWRNGLGADDLAAYGFLGIAGEVVPLAIVDKPPSAELREGQADADSLPPYPVLDSILRCLVERAMSVAETVAALGHPEATVAFVRRLVDVAEYKRRQSAPGVRITGMLHGRDRRYPIVNAWRP